MNAKDDLNKRDVGDVVQIKITKESLNQILDSLERTERMDLALKIAGLIPKKMEESKGR